MVPVRFNVEKTSRGYVTTLVAPLSTANSRVIAPFISTGTANTPALFRERDVCICERDVCRKGGALTWCLSWAVGHGRCILAIINRAVRLRMADRECLLRRILAKALMHRSTFGLSRSFPRKMRAVVCLFLLCPLLIELPLLLLILKLLPQFDLMLPQKFTYYVLGALSQKRLRQKKNDSS